MGCDVCGYLPRPFETFGGGFYHRAWGEYLCPCCWFWLRYRLGIEPLPLREVT